PAAARGRGRPPAAVRFRGRRGAPARRRSARVEAAAGGAGNRGARRAAARTRQLRSPGTARRARRPRLPLAHIRMTPPDREIARHRIWLGFAQQVGLVVSPVALVRAQAVPERNVAEPRQSLIALAGDPDDPRVDFPALAERILGWEPGDLAQPAERDTVAL